MRVLFHFGVALRWKMQCNKTFMHKIHKNANAHNIYSHVNNTVNITPHGCWLYVLFFFVSVTTTVHLINWCEFMKLPVQAIAHNAIQFSVYILYKICSIYFTGPKFTNKKAHAKIIIIIITGLHNAHPKKWIHWINSKTSW